MQPEFTPKETDPKSGDLPIWEDGGRETEVPFLPVSEEEPSVEGVLPAADAEVPKKLGRKPGKTGRPPGRRMMRRPGLRKEEGNLDADYDEAALRSDKKFRKKFGKSTRRGTKGGHYAYRDKTLKAKVVLDPVVLEAALNKNKEYRSLQAQLKTPIEQRQKLLKEKILKRELPGLRVQMNVLQKKIEPLVEQLCKLDTQMKRLQSRADYLIFKAKTATPDTKPVIHRRIALVVKRISESMRRSLYENNRKELRRLHGFWDYVGKKYRQPSDPPFDPQQQKQETAENDDHEE
ncbi:MAG: hypothetical protein ABIP06_11065 [Pyrinomonadaceae bacterium]